jgi:hypothetical protein
MLRHELFEVIVNFERALKQEKFPDFNKNLHRVEQVLRILQVDYHDFEENEDNRACRDEIRDRWEKFWTYPKVKNDLARMKKDQPVQIQRAGRQERAGRRKRAAPL